MQASKPLPGRDPQHGQGFHGWGGRMSLPVPGEVWWQSCAHALSLHMFTRQRRRARCCSRGASSLSREAGGGRSIPLLSRRAHCSLFTACLPLLPLQAAGFFFGKHGSACAFAQLRAPVTLIVTSVQRDKNLIGELGKARRQQVTPPRSGFKSAFKGPRSKCAASPPETMRRSRGESQLAHVFLSSSY